MMGSALGGAVLLNACGTGGGGAPAAPPTAAAPATLDEIVAAAEAEGGDLIWYLPGQADTAQALQEAFKAKYPFTNPQVQSLVFRDMANKLITESITGAPTADVFMLPSPFRQIFLDNDVVVPTTVPAEQALPQDLLDPDGFAHPVYILLITTIYNTNSMPSGPPKPADMADPQWAGKIAFDRVQGLGQSTMWLASWRNQMGDAEWVRWLDGLQANDIFVTGSGGDTYAAVLRGDRAFGIGSSNDINAQEPGTPMAADFSYPPVPFVQNLWLTRQAAHPATGRLFIEWALGEDGQQTLASTGRSPVLQTVDSPVSVSTLLPEGIEPLPGTELRDFFGRTNEYVSILDAKWPG